MGKRVTFQFIMFVMLMLILFSPSVYAVSFDPVPPTTPLVRGQNFSFGININTEGNTVTTIQTGLEFDPTLLEYVSVTPGQAMNSVVADTTTYGAGKVLFTGTNTAGFNGTGVFATVIFKLIAATSGQTDICSLWLPEPTPSAAPSPTIGPSPTVGPSPTPGPTLPPQPTSLPKTGITDSRNTAMMLAISFLIAAGGVFYLSQKQKYSHSESSQKNIKNKPNK